MLVRTVKAVMELCGDVSCIVVALLLDVLLEQFPLLEVQAGGQVLLGLAYCQVVLLVHILYRSYLGVRS